MNENIKAKVAQVAQDKGIDPDFALSLAMAESRYNPNAVSPKGAQGVMQIMPATFNEVTKGKGDINNVDHNIDAGLTYLKQQLDTFGGDKTLAAAAYNAGPGAVKKYNGVPPYKETQDYVNKVVGSNKKLVGFLDKNGQLVPAQQEVAKPSQSTGKKFIGFEDELYPQEAPAQIKPVEQPKGATAGDYAKQFGASALDAIETIGKGGAEIVAKGMNAITDSQDYYVKEKGPLGNVAQTMRENMTAGGKEASNTGDAISGDLFTPETWKLTNDPEKLGMFAVQSLGSLATWAIPGVAALRGAKAAGVTGAVVGGASTAGDQASDARLNAEKYISQKTHQDLLAEVPRYAELYSKTGNEAQARAGVINDAGFLAGVLSAPIGAIEGSVIGKMLPKGLPKLPGVGGIENTVARRGAGAIAGFGIEGGQEALEKSLGNMGENIATGRDAFDNVTRNTFPEALGGGLVGGGVGAISSSYNPTKPQSRGQRIIDELKRRQAQATPQATPQSQDADLLNTINANVEAINASDVLGEETNVSDTNTIQTPEMASQAVPNAVDNLQGSAGNSLSEPAGTGLDSNATALGTSGANDLQRGTDGIAGSEAVGGTKSWVIVNKETGEPVMETFQKSVADKVNTEKYKAIPIAEYLPALNNDVDSNGNRKPVESNEELLANIRKNLLNDNGGEPFGNSEQLPQQSSDALQLVGNTDNVPTQAPKVSKSMSRAQDVQSQDGLILQNRDRSSPTSINQMQSIAAAPDFLRAGISNDMQTGAPIVFGNGNALPQKAVVGEKDVTVDGKGNRYDTQYAVVEADDLITSHDVSGIPKQEYQTGASGKLRVVAGNGRAAGIMRGHEQGTTGAYKADLIAKAGKVGIDANELKGFKNPVLVRVMPEGSVTDDIGDLSNISQTAQLSPVEQAKNDAQRLNVDGVEYDVNGNMSDDSVRKWVASLPDTEKTGLSSNGAVSRQAIDRVYSAIFYKAYGSDELVRLYAEATDEEAKNVINALGVAAPSMIKLEGKGDLDVRGAVVEAAGIIINAKRSGKPMAEYLDNVDALSSDEGVVIARFFASNMRAKNKIAEGLKAWADEVVKQAELADTNATQGGFFGAAPVKTRQQLFEELNNGTQPEQGQQQSSSGINAQPTLERQRTDTAGQRANAGNAETQAPNEVTGTPRGNGESQEREGVRAIVAAIGNRRAAARQINKEKAFSNHLKSAKQYMAGENVPKNTFKLAAKALERDTVLSDLFKQLDAMLNSDKKSIRQEVKGAIQNIKDLIETAESESALTVVMRKIESLGIGGKTLQELEALMSDKQDEIINSQSAKIRANFQVDIDQATTADELKSIAEDVMADDDLTQDDMTALDKAIEAKIDGLQVEDEANAETAPVSEIAQNDNVETKIADKTFIIQADSDYGSVPVRDETIEIAKKSPKDHIVLEIIKRPNGNVWHNAFVSDGEGDLTTVNIGSDINKFTRQEIIKKANEQFDYRKKQAEKGKEIAKERVRLANEKGIKVGVTWKNPKAYVSGKNGLVEYDYATITSFNTENGLIGLNAYKRGMRQPAFFQTDINSRFFDNYPENSSQENNAEPATDVNENTFENIKAQYEAGEISLNEYLEAVKKENDKDLKAKLEQTTGNVTELNEQQFKNLKNKLSLAQRYATKRVMPDDTTMLDFIEDSIASYDKQVSVNPLRTTIAEMLDLKLEKVTVNDRIGLFFNVQSKHPILTKTIGEVLKANSFRDIVPSTDFTLQPEAQDVAEPATDVAESETVSEDGVDWQAKWEAGKENRAESALRYGILITYNEANGLASRVMSEAIAESPYRKYGKQFMRNGEFNSNEFMKFLLEKNEISESEYANYINYRKLHEKGIFSDFKLNDDEIRFAVNVVKDKVTSHRDDFLDFYKDYINEKSEQNFTLQPETNEEILAREQEIRETAEALRRESERAEAERQRADARRRVQSQAGNVDNFVMGENSRQAAIPQRDMFGGTNNTVTLPEQGADDKPTFSRSRAPKEDFRDMFAQHNISEDGLFNADKIGGLAVPSLAVTKADLPLENFGEITLIAPKTLIDPKGRSSAKVFGADIYSPRYPEVTYKFDSKIVNAVNESLKSSYEATESRPIRGDDLDRNAVRTLKDEIAIKHAFLKSVGEDATVVYKEQSAEQKAMLEHPALKPFVGGSTDPYDLTNNKDFVNAYFEYLKDKRKAEGKETVSGADFERKQNIVRTDGAYAFREAVNSSKAEVDKQRTRYEFDKVIEAKYMDDFNEYVQRLFNRLSPDEKLFEGYTYSGTRRYSAHTLENVVKKLKKDLRGGEGWNYGLGSVRSKFTPEFKSIAEIKKNKDRIVTNEEFEAVKAEQDAELFALADKLSEYHDSSNQFAFLDTVTNTMMDAATMGVNRALSENQFKSVPIEIQQEFAEFLTKLRNMPTEYFEAKVTRAVGLNEFIGAVVPDKLSKKALDILKRNGIENIYTYSRTDGNRADVIKKALNDLKDDAMFSRSNINNSELTYPLADRDTQWYGEANYKENGGRLVYVTPDEYLKTVKPLVIDDISRENIDDLKQHIKNGGVLDPLTIYANGKEDGRHRANAAKELGIQYVPVVAYGNYFKGKPQTLPTVFSRAPTFYSQLSRAIDSAKFETAPATQWKLWLVGNAGNLGVKKDEIQWTGITDWLSLQTGKVSKADIQAYLDGNGVQVTETMLGWDGTLPELPDGWRVEEDSGKYYLLDDDEQVVSEGDTPREAIENGMDIDEVADNPSAAGKTKYGTYTVPGGENYKELLLTLPVNDSARPKMTAEQLDDGTYQVRFVENDRFVGNPLNASGYVDAVNKAWERYKRDYPDRVGQYKSTHWDERNVLAHVRFDERTDADGNKTLFIQEIQSDFGQDFKKAKDAINNAVDNDFNGIIERMKAAGVLEVNCD